MDIQWQTWAAVGIVVITAIIFVIRISKSKKTGGCGHDCGCGKKK